MSTPVEPRNRAVRVLAMAVAAAVGIGSRQGLGFVPDFAAAYTGDTLWALFVFLGVGVVFPRWTTLRVAAVTAAFSLTIELSQLAAPDWLEVARSTRLGALVLGHGFLWSDLLCYATGIGIGAAAETLLATRPSSRTRTASASKG